MIGGGLGLTQRAVLGGGAPSGPVTLIYDSFTEAGTTGLVSHTPDTVVSPAATPWAQTNNFIVDSSGVLESGVSTSNAQCHINGGISDGIVSAGQVARACGLVFRRTDTTNQWLLYNRTNGATSVELYEVTGATLTVRGSYNVGAYATRKLQVIANGTAIDCYIDDTLRISHTSSAHQTSTRVGFRADNIALGGLVADELRVIDSTNAADLP